MPFTPSTHNYNLLHKGQISYSLRSWFSVSGHVWIEVSLFLLIIIIVLSVWSVSGARHNIHTYLTRDNRSSVSEDLILVLAILLLLPTYPVRMGNCLPLLLRANRASQEPHPSIPSVCVWSAGTL